MTSIWKVGDRVLTDIGEIGEVVSVRYDSCGESLVTIALDNPDATPDGHYLARDFELKGAL